MYSTFFEISKCCFACVLIFKAFRSAFFMQLIVLIAFFT